MKYFVKISWNKQWHQTLGQVSTHLLIVAFICVQATKVVQAELSQTQASDEYWVPMSSKVLDIKHLGSILYFSLN